MWIEAGFDEYGWGIERRRFFRRLFLGPPVERLAGGRHPLERLADLDPVIAGRYRPKLRGDVQVTGTTVAREGLRLGLDPEERAWVVRFDGRSSARELARANAPDGAIAGQEALSQLLRLISALAEFDLLETGVQEP